MLPRVGDRHRYVPIAEVAYREIRGEVENGAYEYEIEDGTFSLREYLESYGRPVDESAR